MFVIYKNVLENFRFTKDNQFEMLKLLTKFLRIMMFTMKLND